MSERANLRLSFSATVPNLQIAWDSISLGLAKKCWRKYYLAIVEGWERKNKMVFVDPSEVDKEVPKNLEYTTPNRSQGMSLHLRYGILYHRALEVYDHAICDGLDHDSATAVCLRDLAEGCLDHIVTDRTPEVEAMDWSGWMVREATDEHVHLVRWWDPNDGLSEKQAKTNTKTVPNLFRTIVWYLERFGPNDPAKTVTLANGKPAVELSFRFQTEYEFSTGEPLTICGHLDRVVEYNGKNYVLDRKTTKSTIDGYSAQQYFAQYSPNNQMSLYNLAGTVVMGTETHGVIIDAAQIAMTFSRFERGFANRTEALREEWLRDTEWVVTQAEYHARKGYWPMNDTACDDYGGCVFRDICKKDPAVRDIFLKANFQKRYWDPFEVRGDI